MPVAAPLHPWEFPQKPWSRIHLDYARPSEGKILLIICISTSLVVSSAVHAHGHSQVCRHLVCLSCHPLMKNASKPKALASSMKSFLTLILLAIITLIIVDAYSKWLNVHPMNTSTSMLSHLHNYLCLTVYWRMVWRWGDMFYTIIGHKFLEICTCETGAIISHTLIQQTMLCKKVTTGIAQENYKLYWTNPGSNIPQNRNCTATYIPSLKPSK